ncbi:tripartite tricarboxylate transporter TctB family protein [Rhodoplanes sp. TEM]|uniref:Tripartite tricarboxylate transporter TctB family protein n=1 Tax=Rhodoplanes tepidamans TaxID=200616 RepID=A0ABT5JB08_RHOTP|nr:MULTISPECIES: tripartite tricarboxylate transporter TctB family protein [Rhodoplanes]MDC7786868.1 tripartite tricarboxylate transporter TctB family protein [Rhodoplanes tepidamans]MDC7984203.1 tripartite tricarboxylate transporter TctB family protein [Rhodoplanes sp. TEM]MDQ0355996.1 putative membrane protein YedE/YeeE [Rhodoplanes tepidamans]
MTEASGFPMTRPWRRLIHRDVLSGLLFIALAGLGLWLSRDYPVGTALRMGTGYVPRLLCWILLGLGAVIALRGFMAPGAERSTLPIGLAAVRPVILVFVALVVFGVSLERLGLVISILLLVGIGALAGRNLRPAETVLAAVVLVALAWGVFIAGLGLTIPVWPEW